MPESEIRKRGGARYYRTIKRGKGKYLRVAIVRKKGARGGQTIAGPVHDKKAK
jgi:hypothetical protein